MEKIERGNPLTQSADIVKENLETLKRLFPTIVKEGKIDVDELKALIDDEVETSEEYYRFTWAGKSEARREANKPSTGTLRPNKVDSKNWDTTGNIFIEGDNLEVLKLMQKSYAGKIKIMYFDPPYNTGKDFVYRDNYADNLSNYLALSKQTDDEGNKLSTNTESDGRYHSNWLNMLYPRLKLARNLLTEDGVVFISIDDNEVTNLRKLCDEIFGEENFVNCLSVNMKNIAGASGGGEDKKLKKNLEFILIYCKNYFELNQFVNVFEYIPVHELVENYRIEGKSWKYTSVLVDNGTKEFIGKTFDGDGNEINIYARKNPVIKSIGQLISEEGISEKDAYLKYSKKIFQSFLPQSSIRPRVVKKISELGTVNDLYSIDYIPKSGRNKGEIYEQFYKGETLRLLAWLSDVSIEINGTLCKKEMKGTYWDFVGETKNLTKEGDVQFPNGKKPLKMLQRILSMIPDKDFLVLDFFAGSSTTAHAVLQINSEDGGKRKFIMVQFPELLENNDTQDNFKDIAVLSRERIKRAGEKIISELNNDLFSIDRNNLDTGFKAFKLDSSNIHSWDGSVENFETNLFNAQNNIKDDRTEEDVLYEILLKYGLDLTVPIQEKAVGKCKLYSIGLGVLFICLSDNITTEVAKAIGEWKKELEPATCRVLFKDNGFIDDVAKTNSVQILRQFGIEECNSI